MKVDPVHAPIGSFFINSPMFRVPKYQRSYAWDKDEVEDFIKDMEQCFLKRKANTPINHFFGGMVSVERPVTGVVKQHEYELVDGQQRCATFVLTAAVIISIYKKILVDCIALGDTNNKTILEKRISKLSERFIEFEQEVNRNTLTVDSLVLSKADSQFFKDLIRDNNPTPDRESHSRLRYAYEKIRTKIEGLIDNTSNSTKIDDLELFQQLLDIDFSIIHIVTYDTGEAYRLFQVLNDRGKSLTDGDLLRAKTLELLEGFTANQTSAEVYWDKILIDNPKITENNLRWIYSSHNGSRAGTNTLFDDFLKKFYPQANQLPIDVTKSNIILNQTKEIYEEIEITRKISEGQWPFSNSSRPITAWDRNRLSLLINELGFTVTVPILLAAYKLGERSFSEVVQTLEKFLFRYKTVSNAHIEAVVSALHSQSVVIRANIGSYNVSTLKNVLRPLLNSRANDTHFKSSLDTTMIYKDGGGNKPLKYLLMTLEHYKRWYDTGANGDAQCMDKTRVYDFASTTIEHIYPRNATAPVLDILLEPLKNQLENLTFMGPTDNVAGGNDSFQIKKPIFSASSVGLNQDIGRLTQWTPTELTARKNKLKDMACKIFNF